MRAILKHRAFSSVAIFTSIFFVANISISSQVQPGTGAPGLPSACNPPPAELKVEVKRNDNKDEVRVSPPGAFVSGRYVEDIGAFFLIEFGLLPVRGDPHNVKEMTQIDPPTLQIEPQAATGSTTSAQTGTGSGDSIPKYTQTGGNTPKDPKLTAWESMRAQADLLDATGDPALIRLARAIRIRAESIFQAPVSGVSSATGSVPPSESASRPLDLSGYTVDRATGAIVPKRPAGETDRTFGVSGFTIHVDLKIPSLSRSAFPGGRAAVTYELPVLASLLAQSSSTKLPANIGGFWTYLDANKMPSLTNVNKGRFENDLEYFDASIEFYAAIEELEWLAGAKPLSSLPLLLLTLPKLHVELDGSEDSDFLIPYEDKGEILLDTKITLVPGATQQIDWWSKNGLREVKQSLPTGSQSLDVSNNHVFSIYDVAFITAMSIGPGCDPVLKERLISRILNESNPGRNVAPAPSLDPAYWPKTAPEPLRVSLSADE